MKPRVLLLTNENKISDTAGQINGYELMVETGELKGCNSVSIKEEACKKIHSWKFGFFGHRDSKEAITFVVCNI